MIQCDVENHKQNQARQNALISSLQQRVRDAEDKAGMKENSVSRNEIQIMSLQKELQAQLDKRQQLETSLKHHLSVSEDHHKKSEGWEQKVLQELFDL